MHCGSSELQSAKLLVYSQDVMVKLSREKQVLQGAHVLLDDHVMLRKTIKDMNKKLKWDYKAHKQACG